MVEVTSPGADEPGLSAAFRSLTAIDTLSDIVVAAPIGSVDVVLPASIFDTYDSIDYVAFNAKPVSDTPQADALYFQIHPAGVAFDGPSGHHFIGGPSQSIAQEFNQMRFTVHLGKCVDGDKRAMLGQWIGMSENGANANNERDAYTDPHTNGLTVRWFFLDAVAGVVNIESGRFVAYGHKLPPE